MSRPRKSLRELELNGTLKHDPKKYSSRIDPPKAKGRIGAPPSHFDQEQIDAWKYLVSVAPKGLLGGSDRPSMEMLAVLTATFRKHGVGGKFGITSRELSLIAALHDKFGMTPIGRSRLNLPKEDEGRKFNEFAAFIERRQAEMPN